MIGVSANGRAILVASNAISTGGEAATSLDRLRKVRVGLNGFASSWFRSTSQTMCCFLFLSTFNFSGCCPWISSLLCLVLRFFSPAGNVGELNDFFLGLVALTFGATASGSLPVASSSIAGSTGAGLAFFERVRLNVNPSSSSSYAAKSVSANTHV